ncbi:hypothetical protein ABTY98_39990 [Streptomyces sp. NPDC096040]|uniref:hypothetical protein n=1 Tax=Streptomyces sp. NPDC096040 TaxID=3155541 RepID=UPI0033181606
MIVGIFGLTIVLVVKYLSSAPARITAVLGAAAVLFGVIPHIVTPMFVPSTVPAPAATVTVVPGHASTDTGLPLPSPSSPAFSSSRVS